MAIQFTHNAKRALLWAQEEAMRQGQNDVGPHHLLLGLLHASDNGAIRLLDRLGLSTVQVAATLGKHFGPTGGGALAQSAQLGPDTKRIVDGAFAETEASGEDVVGCEHLLLALVRHCGPGAVCDALGELGVTYDKLHPLLARVAPEPLRAMPPTPDPARSAPLEPRPGFLQGRDLASISDLRTDEIRALFELTRSLKNGHRPTNGQNKTLALVFEKPSLRTRVSFCVAMTRLGGQNVYLSPLDIGLGTREEAGDVARCLGRWVDAIVLRTFDDATVRAFADAATIPVINGLTDREHPCQALADFYTILEHKSQTDGMKLVYVGDASNNVAASLLLLAPRLGTHLTLACPPGYEPRPDVLDEARAMALANNTQLVVTNDALEAADDADVLYTDVWTSMGQEDEGEKRARDFAGFQINDELVREAKEDVLVLHCLPAHRGHEITGAVLDGPQSGVFDQAENRLHVQMALLAAVL